MPHDMLSWFLAQPAVSVSVDVVGLHVPLPQKKSVRPREREPEFEQLGLA